MSERVPDPATSPFGRDGMRRFTVPASPGVRLPDAVREALTDPGVPLPAALDRRMPVIAASTSLPVAAAAFRELNAELRHIDAAAFEDRESWWPKVLDDVRHTLHFPFCSAFEYVDASGAKQIVTDATGPGRPHPEELVLRLLRAGAVHDAGPLLRRMAASHLPARGVRAQLRLCRHRKRGMRDGARPGAVDGSGAVCGVGGDRRPS